MGVVVEKMFVGHVRFAADGAPEFAKGWDDAQAPKVNVSATRPDLLTSRGWFDAYSTSSPSEPLTIESCRCGAKKTPPGLPAAKPAFVKRTPDPVKG